MARVHRQTLGEVSARPALTERGVRGRALQYLCHFLEVFVPFLEGPRSVQGLSHTRVLAEEGLAVVLDPVQHLRAKITKKREDAERGNSGHKEAPYGKRTGDGGTQVNDGGEVPEGKEAGREQKGGVRDGAPSLVLSPRCSPCTFVLQRP